jgi:HAE1 family hydrophobic/amphiphilic exporter-1
MLGRFFDKFNIGFDKLTDKYVSLTRTVASNIRRGIMFLLIVVVGLVFIAKIIPGGCMPEEDMGYLFVNIQLPDAASLQRSDVVTKKVEKIVAQFDQIEYITSAAGFSLLSGSFTSNASFMFISLKDWSDRDETADEIVDLLNIAFHTQINEAQVFAFGPPAIPGLGSGSGFTIMLQDKGGNTPEYLAQQSVKFIQAAMQRPEIGSIFTTFRANVPQRFMDINTDKALKAGIPLNNIYSTVGASLRGTYVNDFTR